MVFDFDYLVARDYQLGRVPLALNFVHSISQGEIRYRQDRE